MTKVTIISGFLGAGKTTLIKKLLKEVYDKEQVVLIENEFGEIGIDGGFLKDAGVEITEMNSGCICCSLSGDFSEALHQVLEQFHPDRIIIEPSGVGKLSDVKRAVLGAADTLCLESCCTVVDVAKCAMYQKNFGEFFNNQIQYADALVLSRTQQADASMLEESVELLRTLNAQAPIVTTPWEQLNGGDIVQAMLHTGDFSRELLAEEAVCEVCGHPHHHHLHEELEEHPHVHHPHGKEEEHSHAHAHEELHAHHPHHGEAPHAHSHKAHHEEEAHAHSHAHHHHHHHHDADEVFTSWGRETLRVYTRAQLESIVQTLSHSDSYGQVLRAKGIVQGEDAWYYFDVTPQEYEIRTGAPTYAGRYCVIGAQLQEEALRTLFEGEKPKKDMQEDASFTIEVD